MKNAKFFITAIILLTVIFGCAVSLLWATVSSQTVKQTFPCDGSNTTFNFTFRIYAVTDLVVRLRTDATGSAPVLTYNSDYTLSATNNDYTTGGTITTTSTYPSGCTLIAIRDTTLTQEARFVGNRPLENTLDRKVLAMQELKELFNRSISAPPGDSSPDMELPSSIERASNYLAFDANGDVIASAGTTGTATVSAYMATVLDDANAYAARATLNSGTPINIQEFGAVPDDNTDDTTVINNALAAASVGQEVYCPPGTYDVNNGTMDITTAGIHLRGAGRGSTIFQSSSTDTVIEVNSVDYVRISSLTIDGNDAGGDGIYVNNSNYYHLYDLRIDDCQDAIEFNRAYIGTFSNSDLRSNVNGFVLGPMVSAESNNAILLDDITSSANSGWGGIINGGQGINIFNCKIDGNAAAGGNGIKINGVAAADTPGPKITHNWFEMNGLHLLVGDSNVANVNDVQDAIITHNYMLVDPNHYGIKVDAAAGTLIADNKFTQGSPDPCAIIQITANATKTHIRQTHNSRWWAKFSDSGVHTTIIEEGSGVSGTSHGDIAIKGNDPNLALFGLDESSGTATIKFVNSAGTTMLDVNMPYVGGDAQTRFHNTAATGGFRFIVDSNEVGGFVKNGSYFCLKIGSNLMTWSSAAPTDGTWAQGDVCWNTGAGAGGAPGWVCVTADSPGTWKEMGDLDA